MKKFFASILAVCAISAHAQPAGFIPLGESSMSGQAYIGNIRPQSLTANPSVKLAEYTMYYAGNGTFTNFVADCMRPDVSFGVILDANGNKYRGNPFFTPQGTLGWTTNVIACTQAYQWPETKPNPPSKPKERLTPA
jgi:hypothetical protein